MVTGICPMPGISQQPVSAAVHDEQDGEPQNDLRKPEHGRDRHGTDRDAALKPPCDLGDEGNQDRAAGRTRDRRHPADDEHRKEREGSRKVELLRAERAQVVGLERSREADDDPAHDPGEKA